MFLYTISQYSPKPHGRFGRNVKFNLIKADLKGAAVVDASNLFVKSDLVTLKAKVDKINVDKLRTVPVNLSKISNVVNNDVVKKTQYDTYKLGLEKKTNDNDKKILDISGLFKKMDYSTKITEVEGKIRSTGGLDTTATLISVKNKIRNVSNLLKKKQIITQKYHILRKNILVRLIITNLRVIYLMQR